MRQEKLSNALNDLDEDLLAAADRARDTHGASQALLPNRRIGNWWKFGTAAACFLLAVSLIAVLLGGHEEKPPMDGVISQTLPPISPSHLWEKEPSFDELSGALEREGGNLEESIKDVACVIVKGQTVVDGHEIFSTFLQDCAQKKPATLLGVRYPDTSGSVFFFEIVFDGTTYACTSFEAETPENKTAHQYRFLNTGVEERDGKTFSSFVLTDYEGICWSDIISSAHRSEAVYEWQVYHYFIGYLEQTP